MEEVELRAAWLVKATLPCRASGLQFSKHKPDNTILTCWTSLPGSGLRFVNLSSPTGKWSKTAALADYMCDVVQLPDNLMSDKNFKTDPVEGFHSALPLLNKQLHGSRIDDSMSGTTAIVGLIRGRRLYVANVGDSRAVLAVQGPTSIAAHALSRDQTPFR